MVPYHLNERDVVIIRKQDDDLSWPDAHPLVQGKQRRESTFADDDNYTRHFSQRMQSNLQGFELLINTQRDEQISLAEKQLLITYARSLYKRALTAIEKANENGHALKASQAIFEDFVSRLSVMVGDKFLERTRQASRLLDKAEQYAVLQMGRGNLISISTYKDYTIVQAEEPLPALSDALLNDYLAIIDDKVAFDRKPSWYQAMAPREQTLLNATLSHIRQALRDNEINSDEAKQQISELITTLSSKLRSIPGPPNLSRTHLYIYDNDGNLLRHQQRVRSSMISSRELLKQSQEIRNQHTEANLRHIIDVQLTQQVQKMAADLGMSVQELVNHEQFSLPILVQTLITPQVPKGTPDRKIYSDKQAAIEKLSEEFARNGYPLTINDDVITIPGNKIDFYSTNHPQNLRIGKRFQSFSDKKPAKAYQQHGDLISRASAMLTLMRNRSLPVVRLDANKQVALKKQADILEKAIAQYQKVLDQGSGRGRKNRELILSSLEQVITELSGGVAYGSCVSGKDRKGLETLHTNAMWIFIEAYEYVPDMEDATQRQNFAAIFAQLFVSRHQQENAGQNAPGANAVKTPAKYLPEDIVNAIRDLPDGKRILDDSDRLASNNEAQKSVKPLKDEELKVALREDYRTIHSNLSDYFERMEKNYRLLLDLEIEEVNEEGEHKHDAFAQRQRSIANQFSTEIARLTALTQSLRNQQQPELAQELIDHQARQLIDASKYARRTQQYIKLILDYDWLVNPPQEAGKALTLLNDAVGYFQGLHQQLNNIKRLSPDKALSRELKQLSAHYLLLANVLKQEKVSQKELGSVLDFLRVTVAERTTQLANQHFVGKIIADAAAVEALEKKSANEQLVSYGLDRPDPKILRTLEKILDDRSHWRGTAVRVRIRGRNVIKFGEATGIRKIRGILADNSVPNNQKLDKIIEAVATRGQTKVTRRARVSELYLTILQIRDNPSVAEQKLDEILHRMETNKSSYVERNLAARQGAVPDDPHDSEGEGIKPKAGN